MECAAWTGACNLDHNEWECCEANMVRIPERILTEPEIKCKNHHVTEPRCVKSVCD